jgi:hypothetical protein
MAEELRERLARIMREAEIEGGDWSSIAADKILAVVNEVPCEWCDQVPTPIHGSR